MKPIWIIDAYNVIHKIPFLERYLKQSLLASREALTELSRILLKRRPGIQNIYLVFDGVPDNASLVQGTQHAQLHLIYSQKPQSADDLIIQLLEDLDARSCLVISDDNEVMNNSRAYGVTVMKVKEFEKEIQKLDKPQAETSRKEINHSEADQITQEYKKILGIR